MKDQDIESQLVGIGLDPKEAAAYLVLLKYGARSTSFVAQKSKMNRGTTYLVLHALLEKGLVLKATRGGTQHFAALDSHQLVSLLARREDEARANTEQARRLIKQLELLSSPLASRPKMAWFEGVEGARSAFEQTLQSNESTLRAFLSIDDVGEFLGWEFFNFYTTRRVKKGLSLQVIRHRETDRVAMKKVKGLGARTFRYVTSKKEKREVRYIRDDLGFSVSMYLYDDNVLLVSSKQEGYALQIESAELSQMQKKLFSVIWNLAKP